MDTPHPARQIVANGSLEGVTWAFRHCPSHINRQVRIQTITAEQKSPAA
jgi:hypothetical protein